MRRLIQCLLTIICGRGSWRAAAPRSQTLLRFRHAAVQEVNRFSFRLWNPAPSKERLLPAPIGSTRRRVISRSALCHHGSRSQGPFIGVHVTPPHAPWALSDPGMTSHVAWTPESEGGFSPGFCFCIAFIDPRIFDRFWEWSVTSNREFAIDGMLKICLKWIAPLNEEHFLPFFFLNPTAASYTSIVLSLK